MLLSLSSTLVSTLVSSLESFLNGPYREATDSSQPWRTSRMLDRCEISSLQKMYFTYLSMREL